MPEAQRLATPLPVDTLVPPGTLRAEMERRRASGEKYTLKETIAVVVPLCTDLAEHHAAGRRLFVHPSSIELGQGGLPKLATELAARSPVLPRDRACMAPEERSGEAGDARASVFTIGALIYEMLTGEVVGPGMRRPTELLPGLDPAIEVVLGKALVGDRSHRPDDLRALAQALHNLAPMASIAPPAADESALDHGADFEVDVSLSMLPPAPRVGGPKLPSPPAAPIIVDGNASADPYALIVRPSQPNRPSNDPTSRLSDLKARLESDPRPRYVVIKDGMDHGPFSAVELLQQIGSNQFTENNVLRDAFSNDERPIKDWEEFAPFAEQAKLHREIAAEKVAIEQVVAEEAKGTRTKTFVGIGIVGAILAIGVGFFLVKRGQKSDAISVNVETGVNIETDAGLKGATRGGGRGGPGGPVAMVGGVPQLPGGMSCEAARARYVEEINLNGGKGQADLTAGQFGSILNNGSYVTACGTPDSMHVTVCAAVQNGRAVGVTVTTDPPSSGIAGCIASRVRSMSFPSNPKLDIATTRF